MSTSPQTLVSQFPRVLVIICDVLQILGVVTLVPILCTAWVSSKLSRTSSWFLFIISCILCSISNLLLLGQQTGPEPKKITCLIQVSMLYSAALLNSFSSLSVLLQIYLSIRILDNHSKIYSRFNILINIVPVVISVSVLAASISYGLRGLPEIARDSSGLRCQMPIIPYISKIVLIVAAFFILIFEVLIIKKMRQIGKEYDGLPIRGKIPRAVIKRVLVLMSATSVLVLLGLLSYTSIDDKEAGEIVYDIILSTTSLLTAIMFGTQKDIWDVWMSALRIKRLESRASTPDISHWMHGPIFPTELH